MSLMGAEILTQAWISSRVKQILHDIFWHNQKLDLFWIWTAVKWVSCPGILFWNRSTHVIRSLLKKVPDHTHTTLVFQTWEEKAQTCKIQLGVLVISRGQLKKMSVNVKKSMQNQNVFGHNLSILPDGLNFAWVNV